MRVGHRVRTKAASLITVIAAVAALSVVAIGIGISAFAVGGDASGDDGNNENASSAPASIASASPGTTTGGGDGIQSLDTFVTQFVTGADEKKSSDGTTDYVWTPQTDISGHRFTFRVNFATSGTGSVPGAELDDTGNVKPGSYGTIQIRIPKSILKDKDGKPADVYEMSVPSGDELATMSASDRKDQHYAYSIDGDDIVFYNCDSVTAGQNGYFEVSYITTETTEHYRDYDGKSDASYDDASAAFKADIKAGSFTKSSDEMRVYIDTAAKITSTSKKLSGDMSRTWDSSWGAKPADADDYYYLVWEIDSYIAGPATQSYDFTLSDVPTSDTGKVEVVGYKFWGTSEYTTNKTQRNCSGNGMRYDFVLTRHKKSTFDTDAKGEIITNYTIKNKVTATVHPVDGIDEDTTATASRSFDWTRPKWGTPSGHFQMWKYGNENWYDRFSYYWDYASYDLDLLQDGKASSIDGIRYYIESTGYPFPWTQDTSSADASSSDPAKVAATYGQKHIKNVITDDTLYLLDSNNSTFSDWDFDSNKDADKEKPLTSADYDVSSIYVRMSALDVARDANGKPTYDADTANFDVSARTLTDDDTITVETKSGDTWSTAGTLHMGTGKFDKASGSKVKSVSTKSDAAYASSYAIEFEEGVDGYRLTNTNNYYNTRIYVTPYVSLKNTDTVMKLIGSGDAAKDQMLLKNKASYGFYQQDGSDWKEIATLSRIIGDRLRRTVRSSSVDKNVSAHKNNVQKKRYEITWRLTAEETYTNGTGQGTVNYVQQNGGTFYDLLPDGANFKQDSIVVNDGYTRLDESAYTYELRQNWRDSGRTMLILHIASPGSRYIVYYTTTHAWSSLKDYGTYVKNPVGYETGNDSITNGLPDDGSTLSAANKTLYDNVDESSDAKRFIYSEASDEVSAITAAQSGLQKQVISGKDSDWSYDTTVATDSIYRYRLRFANTYVTKAKNIILYDSLENYQPDANTKGSWHGTLQAVDTSQLTMAGAAPVVYLSAVDDMSLDASSGNTDLTDTSKWLTLSAFISKYGSLASAKAIAIDVTKKTDGSAFILAEGKSIAASLVMKSPSTSPASVTTGYPLTYNNVYVKDTVIDSLGGESDFYINQGYTTVRYAITADFKLHKVSTEDANRNISGIQFRLIGTSDYGTDVDVTKASGNDGIVSFKDIEKGKYTLSEYQGIPDWLEDHTPHAVVIDENGDVTIDGTTVYKKATDTYTPFVIKNAPRVHANVSITKVDSLHTAMKVAKATYRLSGTSDYGNDVTMYSTTDKNGRLAFKNVEKGTYSLKETESPDGYILDATEYTVTIDKTGSVKINYHGYVYGDTVTKYSHTSNVSDDGTKSGDYGDSWTNANITGTDRSDTTKAHVVTIPGATSLHVKIVYGGESANYDWACMWKGNYPAYTAANNYSSSLTGKLGGGSHTSSSNTKEYDVEGDTVTFAFRSDSSGHGSDGYSYYAVVTGQPAEYGNVEPKKDDNGNYMLKDEPYHYITFVKRSSYDGSTIEGAEFSLVGTSDYGTSVNMTAKSDDIGEVRFDKLEPGSYVMKETKAPANYELNTEQHVVTVKKDGTYTITGLSKYSTPSGED